MYLRNVYTVTREIPEPVVATPTKTSRVIITTTEHTRNQVLLSMVKSHPIWLSNLSLYRHVEVPVLLLYISEITNPDGAA